MASSRGALHAFNEHMRHATDHYKNAMWEDMARELEEADQLIQSNIDFPDRIRHRQKIYSQLGALERRYGRFSKATAILEAGLRLGLYHEHDSVEPWNDTSAEKDTSILESAAGVGELERNNTIERIEILGELGVVYRHLGDLRKAGSSFDLQHRLAEKLSWQSGAEVCRAIGNSGMNKYQRALEEENAEVRASLLENAMIELNKRISLAQDLRQELAAFPDDEEAKRLRGKAHSWEAIGIVHLVLCHLQRNEVSKALEQGKRGMECCETLADPTSRAHARFYYGLALWRSGQKDKQALATELFQLHGPKDNDRCTPAIAFCKEPCDEYRGYLTTLVRECHVQVDHFDDQGYSALDYAAFNGDSQSVEIIKTGLINGSPAMTAERVEELITQAHLRKHYRVILQEHFRPTFTTGLDNPIKDMRDRYAKLLRDNNEIASALDEFKFVPWTAFKNHGRLPWFNADVNIQRHTTADKSRDVDAVFMSYRWLGPKDTGEPRPDDDHNTQYKRMCDAIRSLVSRTGLDERNLGIWLDIACIKQDDIQEKLRGIAALPLVIAQCKYMVCLTDSAGDYYRRAWCSCEATLMKLLQESYHQHQRYEHVLTNDTPVSFIGELKEPSVLTDPLSAVVASEQGLSNENDRAQIRFLERQGKLFSRASGK